MSFDLLLATATDQTLAGTIISGELEKDKDRFAPSLSVIKSHRLTCAACGFRSRASKEFPSGRMVAVNRKSQSLLVANEKDGVCLCPYCASAIAINWATDTAPIKSGQEESRIAPGILIYCPWLEQNKISLLANHACAISAGCDPRLSTRTSAAVRDVDSVMTSLNQELGARVPIYRGNDAEFSRALSLLPHEFYKNRKDIICHMRWWPNLRYWKGHGDYFYKAVYRAFEDRTEGEMA